MTGERKELELIPIAEKFIEDGGYRGRIAKRDTLSYDDVIEEVIRQNFLRMEPHALKMLVETVFETMINGTLKDGKSRRLGDYFMLQMEVRGKFDSPGEQFDSSKHKLALVMRPLKAFRRKPGHDDVSVYNRNAGPKVVIESLSSVGGEELPGVVTFGKDFVITGQNLWLIQDFKKHVTDELTVKYFAQQSKHPAYATVPGCSAASVNAEGTRMVVSWDKTMGLIIEGSGGKLDPDKNPPIAVMIGVRSRGGEVTAKQQLHRGKAYFDTWLEKHHDWTGDLSRMTWGHI